VSIKCVRAVLERSRARGTARLVLLVLAEHVGKNGEPAWPAVETIAAEAKLSERQVQYRLRELQALGEIVDVTPAKGERRHKSRDWDVRVKGAADCTPDTAEAEECAAPDCTTEVQAAAPTGAAGSTHGVQPTAPKPSVEPSVTVSEGFASEEGAARPASLSLGERGTSSEGGRAWLDAGAEARRKAKADAAAWLAAQKP
jgi:hypothetical protein